MKHEEHLHQLAEIKTLMEQSTRFMSLSGLSGVSAGVSALLGALLIWAQGSGPWYNPAFPEEVWGLDFRMFEFLVALVVLVVALSSAMFFTAQKARKRNEKLFTKPALRMLWNLVVPLLIGGIFCLLLIKHHYWSLVAPATLVFYGLALINGAKYTFDDIRNLGLAEAILGLLSTYFLTYTLLFWAVGFGVLHIVYGLLVYRKYA